MTGQGVPEERVTVRPRQWALATHKPCPVDGCPGPARVPARSTAHPPALDHGDPDHDTAPCHRCGAGPCAPAEW
ncbi:MULTISPECIES: hypothetical protein [unclassified Streptomyces]|uniref:hypothetical protein n=1 Tax=unclassified Streptomyces TaxID=2593676 RepID=UPI003432E79A